MPETPWFTLLKSLSFVQIKKRLLAWADDAGEQLSTREAKGIAGLVVSASTDAELKRIVYQDPTGESIARRWYDFLTEDELSTVAS